MSDSICWQRRVTFIRTSHIRVTYQIRQHAWWAYRERATNTNITMCTTCTAGVKPSPPWCKSLSVGIVVASLTVESLEISGIYNNWKKSKIFNFSLSVIESYRFSFNLTFHHHPIVKENSDYHLIYSHNMKVARYVLYVICTKLLPLRSTISNY